MGSYTGTVPTFLSGELPDSDKFDEVTDYMTASTAAWTSSAPTWTASAGSPAVGNGTLTGRYRRLGKSVFWMFRLTAGTTTTFGTAGAFFQFTIPGGGTAAETFMGDAWFFDSSAGANYTLTWKMDSGLTVMRFWRNDASPSVEFLNNAPAAMATSDQFMACGFVEIT